MFKEINIKWISAQEFDGNGLTFAIKKSFLWSLAQPILQGLGQFLLIKIKDYLNDGREELVKVEITTNMVMFKTIIIYLNLKGN
jgi:hypothetical protein